MKEAFGVVTTFVFVASFGSAMSHETGSCSQPPPLPNIIAQLINLYRMALSQKNTGRPLPPMSPCEAAALQQSIGHSDLDDYNALPPLIPGYLPPPPFYIPTQYYPSMFPSPPMFPPPQAFNQAYPHPPQAFPKPQVAPNPQVVVSRPQFFPQPQGTQAVPPQHAPQPDPQTPVAPRIIYISQEDYNRAYPDRVEYTQAPQVPATPLQVTASQKPCGCAKNTPQQVNYQYASTYEVQTPRPLTPSQAATQAAQYSQAQQMSPRVVQAPAQMIPQVAQTLMPQAQPQPPQPQVVQAPQMVQPPQALAQPAQAPHAYSAPQAAQQALAQQVQCQYQNSLPALMR